MPQPQILRSFLICSDDGGIALVVGISEAKDDSVREVQASGY